MDALAVWDEALPIIGAWVPVLTIAAGVGFFFRMLRNLGGGR